MRLRDIDVTWASMRFSAGLLTNRRDNNSPGCEYGKIQYDQQEAALVYPGSQMMVSLAGEYNIKNLENTKALLQSQYEFTRAPGCRKAWRRQIDVLTAPEKASRIRIQPSLLPRRIRKMSTEISA